MEIIERIYLPERKANAHKGDNGKGLIIAGSAAMPGAATKCAYASVKSGIGLLKVATVKEAQRVISAHVLEAMYQYLPSDDEGFIADISKTNLNDCNLIALGCGLGRKNHDYLTPLLNLDKPIIIDADGLFHLSQNMEWLEKRASKTVVLTPHEMEMARLLNSSVEEVAQNRQKISLEFAKKHQVYLVLKGPQTIITTPEGRQWLNQTGNQTLAKGGSGDMLTGMILGLMAQNANMQEMLKTAVYLHGMTADLYLKIFGQTYSASITELIQLIPSAISQSLESKIAGII